MEETTMTSSFKLYMEQAHKTSPYGDPYGDGRKFESQTTDHKDMSSMGLFGEAGELVDLLKKHFFHGHPVDAAFLEKLTKEAGDVLWYLSEIHYAFLRVRLAGSATCGDVSWHLFSEITVMRGYSQRHLTRRFMRDIRELSEKLDAAHTAVVNSGVAYDALASLNRLIESFGVSMADVARVNIEKLMTRYPEGFFTAERSINRTEAVCVCGPGPCSPSCPSCAMGACPHGQVNS